MTHKEISSNGGKKTRKLYGRDHFVKAGIKSGEARRGGKAMPATKRKSGK